MNAIGEHLSEIKSTATKMPTVDCIEKLFNYMANSFDEELGGFGGAPKFPQPGKKDIVDILYGCMYITYLSSALKILLLSD